MEYVFEKDKFNLQKLQNSANSVINNHETYLKEINQQSLQNKTLKEILSINDNIRKNNVSITISIDKLIQFQNFCEDWKQFNSDDIENMGHNLRNYREALQKMINREDGNWDKYVASLYLQRNLHRECMQFVHNQSNTSIKDIERTLID